jgi:hypothetical protein
MTNFNLSEKKCYFCKTNKGEQFCFMTEDIKQFIKLLKEKFTYRYGRKDGFSIDEDIKEIIDNLAGKDFVLSVSGEKE